MSRSDTNTFSPGFIGPSSPVPSWGGSAICSWWATLGLLYGGYALGFLTMALFAAIPREQALNLPSSWRDRQDVDPN
jgi:hypothetical protein